jgi:hypothetical protein
MNYRFPPGEVNIVVPHESWATALIDEHHATEEQRIEFEAMAYGDEWFPVGGARAIYVLVQRGERLTISKHAGETAFFSPDISIPLLPRRKRA